MPAWRPEALVGESTESTVGFFHFKDAQVDGGFAGANVSQRVNAFHPVRKVDFSAAIQIVEDSLLIVRIGFPLR